MEQCGRELGSELEYNYNKLSMVNFYREMRISIFISDKKERRDLWHHLTLAIFTQLCHFARVSFYSMEERIRSDKEKLDNFLDKIVQFDLWWRKCQWMVRWHHLRWDDILETRANCAIQSLCARCSANLKAKWVVTLSMSACPPLIPDGGCISKACTGHLNCFGRDQICFWMIFY